MAYTAQVIGGGAAKALSVEQFFDYLKDLDEGDVRDIYEKVAYVYRCIELRANALSAIPWAVYYEDGEDEVDWPIPMRRHLWKSEAFLSLAGANYILKQQNRLARAEERLSGLQVLNAYTMRPVTKEGDPTAGIVAFEQKIGGWSKVYKPEQIVYSSKWSPKNDYGPGVAPGQVVQVPGETDANADVWSAKYFENGAIPLTIRGAEGMIPDEEVKRVEPFGTR